jgi:predicted amidophosphoribosyltransferase
MPFCKNCGAKLAEDAAFCPECGAPVKAAAAPKGTVFRTASWGERFVAWLIDIILIGIFLAPTKLFLFWW